MNNLVKNTLLAASGVVLLTQLEGSAVAQVTTFNNQDLLFGIRATGGTGASTDYLVDIGPASLFYSGGSAFTVTGPALADVVATFGSSWYSRSDLYWGVAGTVRSGGTTEHPNNTMWVTAPNGSPAWTRPSAFGAGAPSGKIGSMDSGIGGFNGASANGAVGVNATLQPTSAANSYASFMPNGANSPGSVSFGFYNPTIENNIATPGSLYEVQPGSGTSTLLGNFSIDSNLGMTFTPVPEPSTYGLVAASGLLMFAMRRSFLRKKA